MKINRSIENELLAWKNSINRKPLILRGARQVGKTFIIEEFGKSFKHFICLNLERPSDRRLFARVNTGKELLERILIYKGLRAEEKETLLFIDEIQNSSEAIRSLRFLYEDLEHLRVIAAGSLLEVFSRKEGFSFPVGRVQNRFMYPVSFREYLQCKNPPLAEKLVALDVTKPTDLHHILLDHFYEYAFVGGMPEALSLYLENGSYSELREVYDSIYMGYLEDVEKYPGLAKSKYLTHTIDHAPLHAGERITYEKFGDSAYKSREMKEAFDTLEKALIVYRGRPSASVALPVLEKLRKAPKLFFLDVGLVNFRIGFKEFFSDRQSLNIIHRGRIAEQIVAQEIISKTFEPPSVNFWIKEKGEAEVDFLYPFKDMLIPIEVKSGAFGKLKSLFLFMEKADHPYAVRIYSGENRVDRLQLPSGKTFLLHSMPFYLLPRLDDVINGLITPRENNR
ncbi:MAG: ATP-binding protein [bacterium]|nr:ATP-binding protein [bacterium]